VIGPHAASVLIVAAAKMADARTGARTRLRIAISLVESRRRAAVLAV